MTYPCILNIVQPRIAFWLLLPLLLALATIAQLLFESAGDKPDLFWTWSSAGQKERLTRARELAMTDDVKSQSVSDIAAPLLSTRPWSPVRWCDLAELYEAEGNLAVAERFFNQATELGGPMPLVWIRKANFHWRRGDGEQALAAFRTALAIPSPYQPAIYVALDGLQQPQERIFREIVSINRRAATDYLLYRIRTKSAENIPTLWRMFVEEHGTDEKLAASVSMKLWAAGNREESLRVWSEATGESPASADLSGHWLPSPFAWRCDGCGEVQMSRTEEKPEELTLIFPGHLNRQFDGLKKILDLPAGTYELRFRWKGNGERYKEGAQFVVRQALNRKVVLARSGDLLGASGWTDEQIAFHLDRRSFVELGFIRAPFRRVAGHEQSRLSITDLSLNQRNVTERTVATR